ncbi:hypothetical protein HK102_013019 [Quaeritorhiza haematococci]|nr:hypothetical protein HK102_013019 [Quaeritorhiza haematococci]
MKRKSRPHQSSNRSRGGGRGGRSRNLKKNDRARSNEDRRQQDVEQQPDMDYNDVNVEADDTELGVLDQPKESSYQRLLGILRKTRKTRPTLTATKAASRTVKSKSEKDVDVEDHEDEEEDPDTDRRKRKRARVEQEAMLEAEEGEDEEESEGSAEEEEDGEPEVSEDDYAGEEEEDIDDLDDEDEGEDSAAAGDDKNGATADSFTVHFSAQHSSQFDTLIASVHNGDWETDLLCVDHPALKQVIRVRPKRIDGANEDGDEMGGDECWEDVKEGKVRSLDEFKVKKRLQEPFTKINPAGTNAPTSAMTDSTSPSSSSEQHQQRPAPFSKLQRSLFPLMNSYRDVLFSTQTLDNSAALRRMYCLHAVNHVFKTRDRILKNNAKIKADSANSLDNDEFRDQGFTRPRVLILLPFRHTAFEVVKHIITLSGSSQQDNKKRFFDEFGIDPDDDVVDPKKPEDHKRTFAGNIDDCFRMGIRFSRKNMKLFSNFYSSDIIVASPLGLRMIIGAEGDKKRDFDFLSSIEVVILDRTDIFLMQNWDNIQLIFHHLNLIPKDPHGCDFSRIKPWYLDGRARYLRQTLIFSTHITPEINSLFNGPASSSMLPLSRVDKRDGEEDDDDDEDDEEEIRRKKAAMSLCNIAGKVKIRRAYPRGAISDVVAQVPQIFQRVPCTSVRDADDARFKYFVEKVLPTLKSSAILQKNTMIFIPSYFDFVRVRNYLKEHDWSFNQMSEYHIRGVHHMIFYGLPDTPHFYTELVNRIDVEGASSSSKDSSKSGAGVEATCICLYTKYDRLKLERVVGTKRVGRMCDGQRDAFMFAS